MATIPIDDSFVAVAEYLATSYRPDREYVDGRIEERNLGEKDHSVMQMSLAGLFWMNRAAWQVEVYPELRARVSGTRFRILDLVVMRAEVRFQRILDVPPLIAIEILSPEDQTDRLQKRVRDYLAFGAEHIWVFDPDHRLAWTADGDGLHPVVDGELTVADTSIRVVLGDVFSELDRL